MPFGRAFFISALKTRFNQRHFVGYAWHRLDKTAGYEYHDFGDRTLAERTMEVIGSAGALEWIGGPRTVAVKGVGWLRSLFKSGSARGVTTTDGFLFRGFTVKTPVNIPVQRFGNMSLGRPDFWGARIGTDQFANRTFGAIKPAWNPLTQYTTGVIPKGTPIKFGIIGPQSWRYPGGSFQFIVPSRSVINQSSKIIPR